MGKGILFLSINDLVDKGMQVIKRTPAHFADQGWDVHYVVTRNESKTGSFYYQEIVNIPNVRIYRTSMPMLEIFENLTNHTLKTIYAKLRGYAAIFTLAVNGFKVMRANRIDVIYGGGVHGVLAAQILGCLFFKRKIISRFYGTFLASKILKKDYLGLILNIDEVLAFWAPCDLMVVTNDGTQGDQAVRFVRKRNLDVLAFWPNGVDEIKGDPKTGDPMVARTVCRLAEWKRVDRGIEVVNLLVHKYGLNDFRYGIVGDGVALAALRQLATSLVVEKNVVFFGAETNSRALEIMVEGLLYFSFYDLSNVGNPLLEAIRSHRIIFTINNGDTGTWIEHRVNGFIYDDDERLIDNIAKDVDQVMRDQELRDRIIANVTKTERERLRPWHERLDQELSSIEKLFK